MFEIYRRLMGTELRKGEFKNTLKFDIQNVDDYLYGLSSRSYKAEDFPNVAPMFDNMWFEWHSNFDSAGKNNSGAGTDVFYGIHMLSEELPDVVDEKGKVLKKADPRWISVASLYSCVFSIINDVGSYEISVMRDGTVDPRMVTAQMNGKYRDRVIASGNKPEDVMLASLGRSLCVVWMALSLAHCKNVEIVERKTPVNRKKKKKKPGYKYYVLEIEPMRKVLKYEGGVEKVGLKKALHICRGHFKDFRDGPGLFGKHKEVYWWNQHVRGDPDAGVVEKDYALGKVK